MKGRGVGGVDCRVRSKRAVETGSPSGFFIVELGVAIGVVVVRFVVVVGVIHVLGVVQIVFRIFFILYISIVLTMLLLLCLTLLVELGACLLCYGE